METWSCAFLGHNRFNYEPYQAKIMHEIDFLIQRGVTHFYNRYRNSFDALCAAAVDKLRETYPQIKQILVLSCEPEGDFALPDCFDTAVYLQENDAPARFAVRNTTRKLVQSVDFVICGVARAFSDANSAYSFAKRTLKSTYNVVTGKNKFWYDFSPIQIDKAVRDFEEKMRTDEEFRMLHEEIIRRCEAKSAPFFEKKAKKRKNKKPKSIKSAVWVVTAQKNKTTEE